MRVWGAALRARVSGLSGKGWRICSWAAGYQAAGQSFQAAAVLYCCVNETAATPVHTGPWASAVRPWCGAGRGSAPGTGRCSCAWPTRPMNWGCWGSWASVMARVARSQSKTQAGLGKPTCWSRKRTGGHRGLRWLAGEPCGCATWAAQVKMGAWAIHGVWLNCCQLFGGRLAILFRLADAHRRKCAGVGPGCAWFGVLEARFWGAQIT